MKLKFKKGDHVLVRKNNISGIVAAKERRGIYRIEAKTGDETVVAEAEDLVLLKGNKSTDDITYNQTIADLNQYLKDNYKIPNVPVHRDEKPSHLSEVSHFLFDGEEDNDISESDHWDSPDSYSFLADYEPLHPDNFSEESPEDTVNVSPKHEDGDKYSLGRNVIDETSESDSHNKDYGDEVAAKHSKLNDIHGLNSRYCNILSGGIHSAPRPAEEFARDEKYTDKKHEASSLSIGKSLHSFNMQHAEDAFRDFELHYADDVRGRIYEAFIRYMQEYESFHGMLFRLIDASGCTDVEIYNRANLDRRYFSKIRSGKIPKRSTVMALCLALHLNVDTATDLMNKAGYGFSDASITDLIVMYCLEHNIYNLDNVNDLLHRFKEKYLRV